MIDEVFCGAYRPIAVDDYHDRVLTCIHEAGHATVAYGLGVTLRRMYIETDGSSPPGVCFSRSTTVRLFNDFQRRRQTPLVETVAAILAAGPAAEVRFCRHFDIPVNTMWTSEGDFWKLVELAERLHFSSAGRLKFIETACARAHRLVQEPVVDAAVFYLTDLLIHAPRNLAGDDVVTIMRRGGLRRGDLRDLLDFSPAVVAA